MLKTLLWGAVLALFTVTAQAQQSFATEFANMREDLKILTQKVGEQSMKIEELERQNNALRAQNASVANSATAYATVAQLNEAIANLDRAIKAGDSATAASASTQIKKLAEATNAALDSMSKHTGRSSTSTGPTSPSSPASPSAPSPVFSDNFPSEGISYSVQKGDTLSTISRKTGAKLSDIINANKISDPTKVKVGDTLFIPGGK